MNSSEYVGTVVRGYGRMGWRQTASLTCSGLLDHLFGYRYAFLVLSRFFRRRVLLTLVPMQMVQDPEAQAAESNTSNGSSVNVDRDEAQSIAVDPRLKARS